MRIMWWLTGENVVAYWGKCGGSLRRCGGLVGRMWWLIEENVDA